MAEGKSCYLCASTRFVDDHHIDCQEGTLSSETVPLCRRCHRTYHDLGVEWFEDKYLDKAIELENKQRQIVYASLENPTKPLVLLKREDIKRSGYYNKTHGIKRASSKRPKVERPEQLPLPIDVGEGRIYSMDSPNLL